jgi:hypothetical protein
MKWGMIMRNKIEPARWQANLTAFGERNNMRPTRLEVLGPDREMNTDLWLEDGLLLAGIDIDSGGEGGSSVEIMLRASKATSPNHMTHTVAGVKRVELETTGGRDEGLEIEDREGFITIMRFETEVLNQDLRPS